MKIMLIDHGAGVPGAQGEHRSRELARGFVAAGHEVILVTAGTAEETEKECGSARCYLIDTPAYDAPLTEKGRSLVTFARKLYLQAPRLAEEFLPEVILVSSSYPYDFFGAQRIAKKCGAKLIYELRALWSVLLRERYRESADSLGVTLADTATRRAVQGADAVVSVLPFCERYFERLQAAPQRYLYIPEIAEPLCGDQPLSDRELEYVRRIAGNFETLLVYVGEITAERRLALLVQAAALPPLQRTAVLLCGNGGYKIALKRMQKELPAANVYLMDRVIPERSAALCAQADCVYFGDHRLSPAQYGYTGPALYDAMRMGRPVLAALSGEENPVVRSGCGINAEESTAQALADAAQRLLSLPRGKREEMARHGAAYVSQNHSPALVCARYLNLISGLT